MSGLSEIKKRGFYKGLKAFARVELSLKSICLECHDAVSILCIHLLKLVFRNK